jgi:hypothetical protein
MKNLLTKIEREFMMDRSDSNFHCPRSTGDFHNPNVENVWALEDLIILDAQKLSEDVHGSCKDTSEENWGYKPCTYSVRLGTFIGS